MGELARESAPEPWGAENRHQLRTLDAVALLLRAERKRTRTIQFMPEIDDVRIEIIDVRTGHYEGIVDVHDDGSLEIRDDE